MGLFNRAAAPRNAVERAEHCLQRVHDIDAQIAVMKDEREELRQKIEYEMAALLSQADAVCDMARFVKGLPELEDDAYGEDEEDGEITDWSEEDEDLVRNPGLEEKGTDAPPEPPEGWSHQQENNREVIQQLRDLYAENGQLREELEAADTRNAELEMIVADLNNTLDAETMRASVSNGLLAMADHIVAALQVYGADPANTEKYQAVLVAAAEYTRSRKESINEPQQSGAPETGAGRPEDGGGLDQEQDRTPQA